jgi:tetratricopeptide (TPR) repeat protein
LTPPDDFDLLSKFYYNKGICHHYIINDYTSAKKFYSKAIELNPDFIWPFENRMKILQNE